MIKEEIFNLFANVQIGYLVDSEKVISGDTRLDSSHFIDDVSYTVNSNLGFTTLSEFIQDVEEPTLFTRIYCDKEFGVPYISSSEMSEIEPPVDSRFISKTLTKNIEQYIIKRGQILVSAAGTVGSIVVATEELDGVAGTSDILRINLDQSKYLGFIYTYLTSSFGANELSNLAYGAIIKRVRGFQLAELKTPIINDSVVGKMNQMIVTALENRDEANRLIKQARSLVLQYNNLPPLCDITPETIATDGEVEIRMTGIDEFTQDYRLDAHFYNPVVKQVLDNIKSLASDYKELGDGLAEKIFYLNRFTRTFVEKGFGIPYMAGKDIIKIRPTDVSYLSYSETSGLDDYKLKTGWILMTCSGTLARTCYIYNNYEDWVATHDLIRIVTSEDLDSGYLYAFLSTEYGYQQAIKFKHGAVIDHLTPEQIEQILIPIPTKEQQKEIGDLVRKAYELRAEAIKLEDEAQELLTQALTQA
jgi:type I restriction enzyme S subunit